MTIAQIIAGKKKPPVQTIGQIIAARRGKQLSDNLVKARMAEKALMEEIEGEAQKNAAMTFKPKVKTSLLPPDKVTPRIGVRGRDIYPSTLTSSISEYAVSIPRKINRVPEDDSNILSTTLPNRR